ncbi:MAG: DoxX family protein [Methylophilus sp.]|jgi:putative oxidoreductase|uniref:DoxX family protein n=1 Tax=Methylophilus sp. TaxID=29541 RepID=UPI002BAFE657|nr:DoxX family protein [Methylophilus sp.]HSH87663.1 DoxX family protein [Methylophilus sp.]
MNSLHLLHAKLTEAMRDLGLLALRIWAGQEFLVAGYTKLSGGIHAPEWFSGLPFPFPLGLLGPDVNWVMAGTGEIVFGLALLVGFYGRLAALGLLFITYVAIYTVHFDLGWSGWNQIDTEAGLGFKVPLMLGLMLFTIVTQGSGRYSINK